MADEVKRAPGYYWVRLRDNQGSPGPWEVAQWMGQGWYFAASDELFFDGDMAVIDERKLERSDANG